VEKDFGRLEKTGVKSPPVWGRILRQWATGQRQWWRPRRVPQKVGTTCLCLRKSNRSQTQSEPLKMYITCSRNIRQAGTHRKWGEKSSSPSDRCGFW